jgi:cardiolipin synthase
MVLPRLLYTAPDRKSSFPPENDVAMPFPILQSFWFLYLLSALLIPVIITKKSRPANAVAWILAIMFLPVLGAGLFLIFGTNRIVSKAQKKLRANVRLRQRLQAIGIQADDDKPPKRPALDAALENIAVISRKLSAFECVGPNEAVILVDAEEAYAHMEAAIKQAERFICLEYYLFEPDNTGRHFRELLIDKARKGVKIHFLYDADGSRKLGWNRSFLKPMLAAGIQPKEFLPLRTFIRPWNLTLRNHRKILIADADVAFAGSLNIGDTFLANNRGTGRPTRETHLMLRGPAVGQLQWIFCEDWYFATGAELIAPVYLHKTPPTGTEIVQVVASGPDAREGAIHKAFLTAISQAREKVYLTSPYFIPDRALELALQMAALRGVDVQLLLPEKSDHPFVNLAGRSYYDNLMQYGAVINTYVDAFLHAKMLVVDGIFTVIGSANADVRSFSYNFEVNVQIYGDHFAKQAEAIFLADLAHSKKLDSESFARRPAHIRFSENFCRLFSPQL